MTDQVSTELALAYVEGATLTKLRERTGLSADAVRRHVINGGATLRPQGQVLVVTPATLAAEYNAGATLNLLATEYATSHQTILKRLRADPSYVPRPSRPPPPPRFRKRVDAELAQQLADETLACPVGRRHQCGSLVHPRACAGPVLVFCGLFRDREETRLLGGLFRVST